MVGTGPDVWTTSPVIAARSALPSPTGAVFTPSVCVGKLRVPLAAALADFGPPSGDVARTGSLPVALATIRRSPTGPERVTRRRAVALGPSRRVGVLVPMLPAATRVRGFDNSVTRSRASTDSAESAAVGISTR